MRIVILLLSVLFVSLASYAGPMSDNDSCFSLSLNGKKITHVVVYAMDFDNQVGHGPVPTFNVRVFDFENNTITGSILDEKIVDEWQPSTSTHQATYPASHHIEFAQTKMNGQKVSYDIKLSGVAEDVGGGITILRGKSEALIDGKKVSLPSLKTVRWCPDPSNRKEFKEIESLL